MKSGIKIQIFDSSGLSSIFGFLSGNSKNRATLGFFRFWHKDDDRWVFNVGFQVGFGYLFLGFRLDLVLYRFGLFSSPLGFGFSGLCIPDFIITTFENLWLLGYSKQGNCQSLRLFLDPNMPDDMAHDRIVYGVYIVDHKHRGMLLEAWNLHCFFFCNMNRK